MADLNNVQGDIVIALPKFHESFLFFEINGDQVQKFRQQLSYLIPLITTAAEGQNNKQKVLDFKMHWKRNGSQKPIGGDRRLTITGINIAFSQKGLLKLGITDDLDDQAFKCGMRAGAAELGDNVNQDWIPAFKNREVDGVILVTGDSATTVNTSLAHVHKIFSIDTLEEIITLTGNVRPGAEQGHEHFGFLDGVSQPAIQGIDTKPNPGQETVPQGIVLALRDGDNGVVPPGKPAAGVHRPVWARDGSFLTFRKLQQLVPEFNRFMQANALTVPPGPGNPTGAEFLAARLVGRWPSGAPLDITPLKDDPSLGGDPLQNDDFSFTTLNPDDQTSQDRCPFAAHIRKSNPRGDLAKLGGTTVRRIVRRGIQYGPEVTEQEMREGRTIEDRGLLFACYQSNIENGFQFIQQSWVNQPNFPPKGSPLGSFVSGLDALIGMPSPGPNPGNNEAARELTGTNPNNPNAQLAFKQWVFPRGGEYFFSPSISALKEKFALGSPNL